MARGKRSSPERDGLLRKRARPHGSRRVCTNLEKNNFVSAWKEGNQSMAAFERAKGLPQGALAKWRHVATHPVNPAGFSNAGAAHPAVEKELLQWLRKQWE